MDKLSFKICRTTFPESFWSENRGWEDGGFQTYSRLGFFTETVAIEGVSEQISLDEFIERPLGTWAVLTYDEGVVYCRSIGAAIAKMEEVFEEIEGDADLIALRLDEKNVGWQHTYWVRRYEVTRFCGGFSVTAERIKV